MVISKIRRYFEMFCGRLCVAVIFVPSTLGGGAPVGRVIIIFSSAVFCFVPVHTTHSGEVSGTVISVSCMLRAHITETQVRDGMEAQSSERL